MTDHEIAAELDALAEAIARMKPPSNHNPHAFHEDRSELASRARSIAGRARSAPLPKPAAAETPAPIGRQAIHTRRTIDIRKMKIVVLTKHQAQASDHSFY